MHLTSTHRNTSSHEQLWQMMTMWCSEPAFVLFTRRLISRPTPRLLSFALCLEWINGIYNTPDTGCLECYRQHASVNTTTLKIDRKHIHCRNMLEIRTRYIPWIVNKRPRNLLNEIQNVFINGKQVKIDKITQIIPWFPRFYATTTTSNSRRRYSPHAWTVTTTTPTDRGFRLRPTRWRPESGSSI